VNVTEDMQLLVEPLGHVALSALVPLLNEIGQQLGLDPCLLAAIAEKESGWDALAVSFDGNFGRGLMQVDTGFHPFAEEGIVYENPIRWVIGAGRTGKAVDVPASVANGAPVFDERKNLEYACTEILLPAFAHFSKRPEIDVDICVIASYNAGVTGVDEALNKGKPPESATFDPSYVPNILRSRAWLTSASQRNQNG
jgi:soluble lytic murein transglycosylase-like protein